MTADDDDQMASAITFSDPEVSSLGPATITPPSSKPRSRKSSSCSYSRKIQGIINRIHKEKIPYIGVYKPGELGRETWRAVVPSPRRKGKGRGVGGQWESIVLSTESRRGVVELIEKVKEMKEVDGVRHIVNPHCNQDEGVRIIWPRTNGYEGGEEEMRDWSRRDRMIKDGKTVQALVQLGDEIQEEMRLDMGPVPPVPIWDNIGWSRLC